METPHGAELSRRTATTADFHPGAMMQAHVSRIERHPDVKLGIISPDGRDAMLQHAEQFKAADIPFVFDPGQGLPMFDGKDLAHFVELASWVTVNDYEGKMLCERTGWSPADISRKVRGLVITLGHEGSEVWIDGHKTLVPPVQAAAVVDHRLRRAYGGCSGLERGWSLAAPAGQPRRPHKIAHRDRRTTVW
jgi:adenosine kinase